VAVESKESIKRSFNGAKTSYEEGFQFEGRS
jgi:hypothetical protein